ncbi:hypothetical protein [Pseudodesulfovibrio sp. zrk46]|uniref:hypothetical protein n=1 Tax=Pseudodesulfovibrio sp. zrk46 TaxID=2725288 RepID=UPI0014491BF3|nr:hypothetical protein [Pseudodesulfovibrio sp. zrk46]QJB57467.1 hypothetical protein HFN16_14090 [Pseudodesulfovibrio sp. zrk46]
MPDQEKMWVNGKVEMECPRDIYGERLADTIESAFSPLRSFADLLDVTGDEPEGAILAGNVLHALVENAERQLEEHSSAIRTHYGKRLDVVRHASSSGGTVVPGTLVGVKEYEL